MICCEKPVNDTRTEERIVLSSYANSEISRHEAMRRLGFEWYGQLLDALSDHGIARPVLPQETREAMFESIKPFLRSLKPRL